MNTVFAELEKAGIETEMILVGKEKIQGCIACHGCVQNQNEACVIEDDPVMAWIMKVIRFAEKEFPPPETVAKTRTNFIR
jgi:multimeric flavodoxin WrbA